MNSPMPGNKENIALNNWHRFVESQDPALLQQLLAVDAVFHSPVVHTPQHGKKLTAMYLLAAASIFDQSFHYVREIIDDRSACLEFMVTIDGIQVNGVDLINWNAAGEITDFKVLIRPLKAIQMLHQKMAVQLQAMHNRKNNQ